jgi:mRNA-degrading endonuclease RelE of RelBE toxin-antitoxin system
VELAIEREAAKVLARMQPKIAASIMHSLKAIAAAPFLKHPNVTRLTGDRDYFRLRRGDWRVLYRVDRARQRTIVEYVDTRGHAYR